MLWSHFNTNCKIILIVHTLWLVNSFFYISLANVFLTWEGSGGRVQKLSQFRGSHTQLLRSRVCAVCSQIFPNSPRFAQGFSSTVDVSYFFNKCIWCNCPCHDYMPMHMKPQPNYRAKLDPASNNIGCACWDSDNTLSNIATESKLALRGCARYKTETKSACRVYGAKVVRGRKWRLSLKWGQTRERLTEERKSVCSILFHSCHCKIHLRSRILWEWARIKWLILWTLSNRTSANRKPQTQYRNGRWADYFC